MVKVTEQLMNELMNGKYSFPDDNFLLWRKKKKTKFTVSSRIEIVREMKVNCYFVWMSVTSVCNFKLHRRSVMEGYRSI